MNRPFTFLLHFLRNDFIYLFLFVLGLCCCPGFFSSCGMETSHRRGFSDSRERALGLQASVLVAHSSAVAASRL